LLGGFKLRGESARKKVFLAVEMNEELQVLGETDSRIKGAFGGKLFELGRER
jgi:hypothetical protein